MTDGVSPGTMDLRADELRRTLQFTLWVAVPLRASTTLIFAGVACATRVGLMLELSVVRVMNSSIISTTQFLVHTLCNCDTTKRIRLDANR